MEVLVDGKHGSAELLATCSCGCIGGYPYSNIASAANLTGPRCGCGCGDPSFTEFAKDWAMTALP